MKKAIDMYDATKYEEQKKREMTDWERSKEEFGSRLRVSFISILPHRFIPTIYTGNFEAKKSHSRLQFER